jgi:hypothetical protein
MPVSFTCPNCGKTSSVSEEYVGRTGPCSACGNTITVGQSANPFRDAPDPSGWDFGPPGTDSEDTLAMRMLLPVGRSPWAIAAGYAGLFSVLLCPAPIAVVLSLIAISHVRGHPDRHGMGRAVFGLVMGILGTLVLIVCLVGAALHG